MRIIAHRVKCYYCGIIFDRDKCEFVEVKGKRYAHLNCSLTAEESGDKEKKIAQEKKETKIVDSDKEELDEYIKKLFQMSYVSPRVQKQIEDYIKKYNFSYSGILKALIYFYEIKGNSTEKSNDGIGIVPYIYWEAYKYYYALWEAQNINKDKDLVKYSNQLKEEIKITIPPPKRQKKKTFWFSFLDN